MSRFRVLDDDNRKKKFCFLFSLVQRVFKYFGRGRPSPSGGNARASGDQPNDVSSLCRRRCSVLKLCSMPVRARVGGPKNRGGGCSISLGDDDDGFPFSVVAPFLSACAAAAATVFIPRLLSSFGDDKTCDLFVLLLLLLLLIKLFVMRFVVFSFTQPLSF